MIEKKTLVSDHFQEFIQNQVLEMEDGQHFDVGLMTPEGFVMGLEELGISDLTETEVHCILLILVKPELENTILATDLMLVMENFGIMEQVSP